MCNPGYEGYTIGLGVFAVFTILSVATIIGWFCVREAYRFGRDDMPWLFGLLTPAVISGIGCYLSNGTGVLAGVPVLVAFCLGRRKARANPSKPAQSEARPS